LHADKSKKDIYHKKIKDIKDQTIKTSIENTFLTHPAYGHRRLAIQLGMNNKKVLRIMHKYGIKPPGLWYQKMFTTCSDPAYLVNYTNLLKTIDLSTLSVGDVWSCDLTYIKFQGKFIYLSIIQDIVSKEIVGFNLGILSIYMSNSKDTIAYFLKRIGNSTRISIRCEFNECTLYTSGKAVAVICDDLLYVPVCEASIPLENICETDVPYLGAKLHYVISEAQVASIPHLSQILLAIGKSH